MKCLVATAFERDEGHNHNANTNPSFSKRRLSRAVAMVRQMDDLVTGDDGGDLYRLDRNQSFLNQGLDEDISKSKEGDEVEELTHGVSLLADESVHITPGFFQVFRGQAKQAACMIYYSRKDAGTPRISPKAGNMVSFHGCGRNRRVHKYWVYRNVVQPLCPDASKAVTDALK